MLGIIIIIPIDEVIFFRGIGIPPTRIAGWRFGMVPWVMNADERSDLGVSPVPKHGLPWLLLVLAIGVSKSSWSYLDARDPALCWLYDVWREGPYQNHKLAAWLPTPHSDLLSIPFQTPVRWFSKVLRESLRHVKEPLSITANLGHVACFSTDLKRWIHGGCPSALVEFIAHRQHLT